MNFTDAVKTCFQKYATFSGRAGKPEYWWFFLFQVIAVVVLSLVSDLLANLASLAMLVPALAVGARRLHDMGKSGWFQLIWLIPLLGWAVMIYWLVQPSEGSNAYGAGPDIAQPAPAVMPGSGQ